MKRWIIGFVVGAILAGASPLLAEDVFRIEIGKKDSSSRGSERELFRRIYQLELAVDQLQRKVFDLERKNSESNNGASTWSTCYIKTTFNGTFSSTKPTETAARAETMEKCSKGTDNSIWCKESDIKCGK